MGKECLCIKNCTYSYKDESISKIILSTGEGCIAHSVSKLLADKNIL